MPSGPLALILALAASVAAAQQTPAPGYAVAPATAAIEAAAVIEIERLEDGNGSGAVLSSGAATAPEPAGLGGDGELALVRQATGEKVSARYRDGKGGYDKAGLAKINRIMRCSLTGRETEIPVKLVELLDAVEDHFGKKGLILLSGYRTKKLNRAVSGAARRSLHIASWAADIKVPGRSSAEVRDYLLKLGVGGVGYYPRKGFVHLDVGEVRSWTVKRGSGGKAPARPGRKISGRKK
ncbi:MAG: DUF882 domain-containing protein [Elusimicrobiales bacterium]|nr:DUF882 domain-containing protein [Elusimicrobiales bacterium]